MKQVVIKDARGHAVATIGSQGEFENQSDSAKLLGLAAHEKMAWIDWIESTAPGNGSELMREMLTALEAEGVSLIGLEACGKGEAMATRLARFYAKFGFVDVSLLAPYAEHPVFLRDSGWNGME